MAPRDLQRLEQPLWIIPTAAVLKALALGANAVGLGKVRLTAATPMDNPYCGCKLTRGAGQAGGLRDVGVRRGRDRQDAVDPEGDDRGTKEITNPVFSA